MRAILLGLPGSGKGTQAVVAARAAGVPHIATGDIFRANVREQTPLGRTARQYMDRGENVPDDVTIAMVRDRLAQPDARRGFILDGFPRTLPQAEALDRMLAELGTPLEVALYLRVDPEVVIRRMTGRRVCPSCGAVYHVESNPPRAPGVCDRCGTALVQRDDDREEVARHRVQVQWAQAEPLLPYYGGQGKLREVDGLGEVAAVTARVMAALGLPA
jgi:adenylate kinase